MNKDDIIRMAREAGMQFQGGFVRIVECVTQPELERFATIVRAAALEEAAKVCENMTLEWEDQPYIAQAELATMMDCAAAIRARSQT